MKKHYLLASDFDQTLSFNDSGIILTEMLGMGDFREKVAGLARLNLVQQGAELAYLLSHDAAYRRVRRDDLIEVGRRVRSETELGTRPMSAASAGVKLAERIFGDPGAHSALVPGAGATQTPYPGSEFVDLGLKVTVTPRLHPDNSVTLKMKVEIKGLGTQDVNGIPVLTNRSFEQTARVVDGQPTLIVSALQPQESLTLTGWPGLQVLAHRNRQNQDTELVIVVRPRLVRMPDYKSQTIYAGVGPGTP